MDGIGQRVRILESTTLRDEQILVRPERGGGRAVIEPPSGLLYHWHKINRRGIVEQAKIVMPTSHSFAAIERDLKELVAPHAGLDRGRLQLLCEQLVRACDSCFSLSVL